MDVLERISPSLRVRARSLADLGLSSVAWPLDAVLDVLHEIKGADVAILGGDVYEERDGQFRTTYDNWHCERESLESFREYANRSWKRAWGYLVAHPRRHGQNLYVVLVVSDEATVGM